MAMGPNMQKVLADAQANKSWQNVGKDRADKRAVASLEKQGLLATREENGQSQFIFKEYLTAALKGEKPKKERTPKADKPKKERKVSNFQKAVNHMVSNPDTTRQDFIKWLREELKLSEAGANTYSSAAMKAAKETKAA